MPPSRRRIAALLLSPLLCAVCGCNLLNIQNYVSTGAPTNADFTGNYGFAGVPGTNGQPASPVSAFVGAIANTGPSFTATFRLITTNGCVSPTQDVNFTGTRASSGQITLTSTNLPNNTMSVIWDDDPTQSSNGIGTYTITGSGPCAMAGTDLVSDQFSPVTGTYTGTFSSSAGVQATVKAILTQGAANADGQFPETGMLILTTPTCTNNFIVSGIVTGPTVTLVFNQNGNSASLGGFLGIVPDHALTMSIPAGVIVTGSCNPGTYSGGLSLQ